MKFTNVTSVPEKRWDKPYRKDIKTLLERFMDSNETIVRVDTEPGEYASVECVSAVVGKSIRNAGLPMKVVKRGNEVYVRKDISND